ncbi:MAG TPA: RNA polymerase factor sigma-32 [Polyangiaceae bacterium]|nr:RNA polymerase factor sigma-32 [Polyangiaceae bacterium]
MTSPKPEKPAGRSRSPGGAQAGHAADGSSADRSAPAIEAGEAIVEPRPARATVSRAGARSKTSKSERTQRTAGKVSAASKPRAQGKQREVEKASVAAGEPSESADEYADDESSESELGADSEIEVDAELDADSGNLDPDVLEATAEVLSDETVEHEPEPEVDSTALAKVDALAAYMREVQRHPLLTPDREHALAVEYKKTGDVNAAASLVTANLRLVVKIAYEYRRAYRNMMDLIQEGNIGLMQAVKRYDPYRGVKLSSYAAWWIRAYMLRFILNNWRMVKIGTTQAQRKLFFNLSKEKARLSQMGIEPTHAEIAKSLNVEESEVMEMDRRLARQDASLDAPVTEGDDRATTRLELLPSVADSPDRIAEDAQLHGLLREKLESFRSTLTGKDIAIFDKRLVADEPLTLQELGDEFGVSRERVRQLEARLTGKLREYLKTQLGDGL